MWYADFVFKKAVFFKNLFRKGKFFIMECLWRGRSGGGAVRVLEGNTVGFRIYMGFKMLNPGKVFHVMNFASVNLVSRYIKRLNGVFPLLKRTIGFAFSL